MAVRTSPSSESAQRSASGRGAAIAGVGYSVPPRVVTTAEIAERLGVDERWILTRTGVRERRWVDDETSTCDLAAAAGTRAVERARVDPSELDLVLVASMSPDWVTPNLAPVVASEIGASGAGAFDVGAACTGFLSGVAMATGYIEAGRCRSALIVGADILSRLHDPHDRATATLFGDGAGAFVLSATEGRARVGPVVLGSAGEHRAIIHAELSDRYIRMQGHDTFRHAVDAMAGATMEALARARAELDDVNLFVYHQANGRILSAVADRLGLEDERVANYVDRFGNTSAASIPIALAAAEEDGRVAPGDLVLLGAFGAGLTWGAAAIAWGRNGA
jgi:3-oxoacyl-[acyl-carrier-protein] synthase-3